MIGVNLDDVLGRSVTRVTAAGGTAAKSASELASESAVEATGSATRTVDRVQAKSPALAAALLALGALGGLTVMRRVFAGAVS